MDKEHKKCLEKVGKGSCVDENGWRVNDKNGVKTAKKTRRNKKLSLTLRIKGVIKRYLIAGIMMAQTSL